MADMFFICFICEKVVVKYWQTLFFAYINMLAIVVLVCVKLCESSYPFLANLLSVCGSIFHYEIITFPERFVSHITCVFKHAK